MKTHTIAITTIALALLSSSRVGVARLLAMG
jgi:hypothetical protein